MIIQLSVQQLENTTKYVYAINSAAVIKNNYHHIIGKEGKTLAYAIIRAKVGKKKLSQNG